MQKDIAPELLERIRADFLALLGDAKPAANTYAAAADYAELVGTALTEAFRRHLTADALPDGRLYWNIAVKVVRPMLEEDHALVSEAAAAVQLALNQQAGIGILPQRAALNEDAVEGLLNKLAQAEHFEDAAYALDEPVRTFSRMVVDDTLEKNVSFQGKAGLKPRVIRTAESGCCKWCSAQAGTYDYPHVPKDVYRRHKRCRCRVEYDPASGRRQDVWSKAWVEDDEARQKRIRRIQNLSTSQDNSAKIEARKRVGLVRYEPDILIPRAVGAKAKDILVRLPDGSEVSLTPGSRITNVQTIAGLGRNRQIDIVDHLVDKYPGSKAELWKKQKGFGYVDFEGESFKAELHWYEEKTIGRVEWKVKPTADGNWFYEDE